MEGGFQSRAGKASGIKVRNFRRGEERALGRLFFQALHSLEARDKADQAVEMLAPDEFDKVLWLSDIPAKRPFVAEVDGDIAGFATLGEPGRIEDFYVLPDMAGKGVGDALVQHVEVIARRQELPELYANVCRQAEPFFHQHGFYAARRSNRFVNGLRIPHTHMRKRLS